MPIRPLLALLLALVTALPAWAQSWSYDHNGSVMRLQVQGSQVRLTYDRPRAGLADLGIGPGTVLFSGTLDNPRHVSGMAWLFSRRCGNIDYYVHGPITPGQSFTLTGAAPVRNTACRIVDNSTTNANARLVFTALAPAPAQDAGLCVRAAEGVALRTGPGSAYGILARLPRGTCNGRAATAPASGWVGVVFGAQIGWAPAAALGN